MKQAFRTEAKDPKQSPFASSDRRNSFVEAPPLSQSTVLAPQSLPSSQAEAIMEAAEQESLTQAPIGKTISDLYAEKTWNTSIAEDTNEEEGGFSSDLGVVQSRPFPLQENDQARYEEGLPLMLSTAGTPLESGNFDASESTPRHEDDGGLFVNSSSPISEAPAARPRPLNRKTTTQVLDSLNYAPHTETRIASMTQGERPSLANNIGAETAATIDGVKSRTLDESHQEQSGSKTNEEDLAELWKAALGDDDLLEEIDPSSGPSFFEDDGEGFLEDNEDQGSYTNESSGPAPSPPLPTSDKSESSLQGSGKFQTSIPKNSNAYVPTSISSLAQRGISPYHPDQTQPTQASSGLSHSISASNSFIKTARQSALPPSTAASSRPPMPESTQSFADKSKGGYTSPYDLPMDVTRPRKRAQIPPAHLDPVIQAPGGRSTPPRSTSVYSSGLSGQESRPAIPSLPGPVSSTSTRSSLPSAPNTKTKQSAGSFFEELPSSKPRSSGNIGKVVPAASQSSPLPSLPTRIAPAKKVSHEQHSNHVAQIGTQAYQMLPPERMSPYEDSKSQPLATQSVPVVNSRYSPAPSLTSTIPPSQNRYAASPIGGPRPTSSHALPHQPRTSSPLAQNTTLGPQQPPKSSISFHPMRPDSQGFGASSPPQTVPGPSPLTDTPQAESSLDPYSDRVGQDPRSQYRPQTRESHPPTIPPQTGPRKPSSPAPSNPIYTLGPDLSSSEALTPFRGTPTREPNGLARSPPRRSQTQSPSTEDPNRPSAILRPSYQRPASVNNSLALPQSRDHSVEHAPLVRPHTANFILPTDGRELDSLERWKGCPIVSFGFGGTMIKTFPQQIPRYAAGQKVPMMKCSPGEVKIEHGKTFALDELIATFPGPLKVKANKKEALQWLQNRIDNLESDGKPVRSLSQIFPDPIKCLEEKRLLWTVIKILVEYDGAIEGNMAAEKAVRAVLSPVSPTSFNPSSLSITRRGSSTNMSDSVRPEVLEELRSILLHGNREQAAWHAVDNRLWAHAMLLSSTLDKNIGKQVAQEFIRQEVKTFGDNAESLSALYQIFAGNWEESVDELVPPSARAGLQMISKTASTGPVKNALHGLDRWRETLALILSNRTADDGKALLALGRLLAGYGRTEAAHLCYIFAKTPSIFGGPDDPQVSAILLGADHVRSPFDYGRDFESILLTEVYEFARTILASSSISTVSPHLQSYKLHHAMILAEYGYKAEAQQYCDTIFSTLKSTTKPSPFYHSLLLGSLETLQDRLRQAPRDISGSWISKPSIDKVSGSIWAKFNSYVAGDEDDTASTGSGKGHDPAAGPFAMVAGDSPTLSRSPSSNELYNTYSSGAGLSRAALPSNSRYGATALYTPRSSLDQDHVKPSANDTLRPALTPQQYSSRPASSFGSSYEAYAPPPQPSSYAPPSEAYLATPPLQPELTPGASSGNSSSSPYNHNSYNQTPPPDQRPAQIQRQSSLEYRPEEMHNQYSLSTAQATAFHEPPPSSYEPPVSNYESLDPSYTVPTSSFEPLPNDGYEPPSYTTTPYELVSPQLDTPSTKGQSKKSIMDLDDDDDFEARAATMRRQEKARRDRETDEAFKKAAEADAQKGKVPQLNSKKSWFGPWFGSSKEKSEASTSNQPIKVKLGEENSFYYDEQLKKWVNKKGGSTEAAAAPAPPPPKGPPSRSVSAAGGPPPSLTSVPPVPPLPSGFGAGTPSIKTMRRETSPSNLESDGTSATTPLAVQHPEAQEQPTISGFTAPGPPSGPSSAPPSRPATGQSGASSIDDLLGAPQARKGGTVRKGKKGRGYVDVMAK